MALGEKMPGAFERARRRRAGHGDEHAAAVLAMGEDVDGAVEQARERPERRQQAKPHQPGKPDEQAMQVFRHRRRPHPGLSQARKNRRKHPQIRNIDQ